MWKERRGEEVKFSQHLGSLTSTLREVLCTGIQYMHLKAWDFIRIRKQLRVNLNPRLATVLERHNYYQKVLFAYLQKVQLKDYGEDDYNVFGDIDLLNDSDGWFYFGAELVDAIGFLESRKSSPSEETDSIHYGGSDWTVGFKRESHRGQCKLGIVLKRCEPSPDRANLGYFYDKRGGVGVEMKLFVDDIVREGASVIGMGNCYVFSGVVSREALADYLVTYDDCFRITVGLRLA